MKIFNHNIESCGSEWLRLNRLYSSRALCLTGQDDIIQLPPVLSRQWPAILSHYKRIGLDCTQHVIWDLQIERMLEYPQHHPSLFFFGDKENKLFPDKARYQITRLLNSKNTTIELAEKLGVLVPETQCFDRAVDAAAHLETVNFPCYLKPAISLSGMGISRCENQKELATALAFSKRYPTIPVQIQKEIRATHFLSLQYSIHNGRLQRLLASEQLIEGNSHVGNRVPSPYAPWDICDNLAGVIQRQGMQGVFAFDLAVVKNDTAEVFYLIECNPRFNSATYPSLLAQKIGVTEWITITLPTPHRDLEKIDLSGIEYDPDKGEGIILINWGGILYGKLMVMLIGNPIRQEALLKIFKQRIASGD